MRLLEEIQLTHFSIFIALFHISCTIISSLSFYFCSLLISFRFILSFFLPFFVFVSPSVFKLLYHSYYFSVFFLLSLSLSLSLFQFLSASIYYNFIYLLFLSISLVLFLYYFSLPLSFHSLWFFPYFLWLLKLFLFIAQISYGSYLFLAFINYVYRSQEIC